MSNLIALGEAIKADNKKTHNPCVLEYKIEFRVVLNKLLIYLDEYYRDVKSRSTNFHIPYMGNIKTNTGALTKLGVALLRMPKCMEISNTTLINSVLSYTIKKKETREKKLELEQKHEQKNALITSNGFAILKEDDDTEVKVSEPNAPRKQYSSVSQTPIIKKNIEKDDFPSFGAPVKAKSQINSFTKDSAKPVKLNFAEVLSKAPSDDEVAKMKLQKINTARTQIETQDKLQMIDEICFSDISDDSDDSDDNDDSYVCEKKETPKKISWADSDSDDDF